MYCLLSLLKHWISLDFPGLDLQPRRLPPDVSPAVRSPPFFTTPLEKALKDDTCRSLSIVSVKSGLKILSCGSANFEFCSLKPNCLVLHGTKARVRLQQWDGEEGHC